MMKKSLFEREDISLIKGLLHDTHFLSEENLPPL
jgi:hypothetical protein